jgi:hypothetical protein
VPAEDVGVRMTYQLHGNYAADASGKPIGVHASDKVEGLHCFLVCRTMYEEAREVFYATNTFVAAHHTAFVHFVQDRPRACRGHIRDVRVHISEALWDGTRHEEGLAEESFGEEKSSYCEEFQRLCRVLGGPEVEMRSVEVSVYGGGLEPSWTGRVKIADCLIGGEGAHRPRFWEEGVEKGRHVLGEK